MEDAMTASSPFATPVAQRAIERIKVEHRSLERVLGAMQALIVGYRDPTDTPPDVDLFYLMLRYIEDVPDRIHHPKEDRVLFAIMVVRNRSCAPLIEELESDHATGAAMLASLRRALDSFSAGEPNAINRLATAVDEFTEFYWTHMQREERQLLPVALQSLTTDDWERIERAFSADDDPLSDRDLAAEYRQLYDRITEMTPQPLKTLLLAGTPA
jgi:hemerythrin-like domain-containing protein